MKKLFILVFLLPFYAHAAIYYVDATDGDDNNNGTSTSTAWQTLAKINTSASAGDTVYFKMGEEWRETLNVPGANMTFQRLTTWGSGNNPRIYMSEKTGTGTSYLWTTTDATYDIYQVDMGAIADGDTTYNILNEDNTDRSPRYGTVLPVPSYNLWQDNYIAIGGSGTWSAIYRLKCTAECADLDALNNQNREVGVRNYGIDFKGYDGVTVDGIDVFGPGAPDDSDAYVKNVHSTGSKDITLKNMEIRFGKNSIAAITCGNQGGDPPEYDGNWLIEDVKIANSWGGIWGFMCNDSTIRRVHITNIRDKPGDNGDGPFIGFQYCDDWVVEDSYFSTRGFDGDTADTNIDHGISLVNGSEGWIFRRNYVRDTVIGGLVAGQVGQCVQDQGEADPCPEDYGNYEIYNNIFDNVNVPSRTPTNLHDDAKKFCGIYMGGGNAKFTQIGAVKIYNNLFINNGQDQTQVVLKTEWDQNKSASIVLLRDYTSIYIANNYFANNTNTDGNRYEIYYGIGNLSGSKTIENNYFYDDAGSTTDVILYGSTAETVSEFNGRSSIQNNVSLTSDPSIHSTTHIITGSTNTNFIAGGIDVADANGDIALHPNRIWTPFASMNTDESTIPRGTAYSIGPFEYLTRNAILN